MPRKPCGKQARRGCRSRLSREVGQTTIEYLGVLALVAAIVVGIAAFGGPIGAAFADAVEEAICKVSGDDDCGSEAPQGPTPIDPELTAAEREALLGDPAGAQEVANGLSEGERAWLESNDPEAARAAEEAISWGERREIVDRYIEADLDEFLEYRDSPDRDRRLDWSTDECSAPLVGSTGVSFDFTDACLRHDFGYRNYKELGIFEENKDAVDNRFLQDMKDHCSTRSVLLQWRCYDWAYTFYYAVRAFG